MDLKIVRMILCLTIVMAAGLLGTGKALAEQIGYRDSLGQWRVTESKLLSRFKLGAPGSGIIVNTPNITFELTYMDVVNHTGVGFDDPAQGAARQEVFKSVLNYIGGVVANKGTCQLLVNASDMDGTGPLAMGGPIFPLNGPYATPYAMTHILTGVDPDAGAPDCLMTVDFGWPWYVGTGSVPYNQIDLYSVLLHEMTHCLGFGSLSAPDGTSVFSPKVVFSVYDNLLYTGNGRKVWNDAGILSGTAELLTGSDGGIFFHGAKTRLAYGMDPAVHAPLPFSLGTSLAHWAKQVSGFPAMRPALGKCDQLRTYEPYERMALADLGYTLAPVPPDPVPTPDALPPTVDLKRPVGAEGTGLIRILSEKSTWPVGAGRPGIAFGDLNGDGYDDMIVSGAPYSLNADASGVVYIIYGGKQLGNLKVINLGAPTPPCPQTRLLFGPAADRTGSALACGDFNGDGIDDLFIGAAGDNQNTGAAYIVYGDRHLQEQSVIDFVSSPGAHGETRFLGGAQGDTLGGTIAAGDIDADGRADLIVNSTRNLNNLPGVVHVIYGAAGMEGKTYQLASAAVALSNETVITSSNKTDQLGIGLASGDLDGDGFDDIIIGRNAVTSLSNGALFVFFGSTSLRGKLVLLTDQTIPCGPDQMRMYKGLLGNVNNANNLGWCVAAGDVNGDGYDDLVAGSSLPLGIGSAFIVTGGSNLRGTEYYMHNPPEAYHGTRVYGPVLKDNFGDSVACSDFNGDGLADLIVGAVMTDLSPWSGKLAAFYGLRGGLGRIRNAQQTAPDVQVLGVDTPLYLGRSVAGGGDLNKDGFGEFAGGAPISNQNMKTSSNSYAVLVFGKGNAVAASAGAHFKSGAAPRKGLGGRLSPAVRTWIAFSDGAGPGGGASLTTVTLTRSALNMGPALQGAKVYWQVGTDRTAFTKVGLYFQYLDSEIGGLDENRLALYRAATVRGPWSRVPGQTLDPERNMVTTQVGQFGVFALAVPRAAVKAGWQDYR